MVLRIYDRAWEGLRASSVGSTPRGAVARVEIPATQPSSGYLTMTGDPRHDSIGLRRCVSAASADAPDLVNDYSDALNRLSAPEAPASVGARAVYWNVALGPKAIWLLLTAVQECAGTLKSACQADSAAASQLRAFL